ncbi:MAG: DUF4838 domain-containing protein [Kiritimatiellia bacterium]
MNHRRTHCFSRAAMVVLGVALISGGARAALAATDIPAASADPAGKLVLVRDGRIVAPIVVFKDAPPLTREVADVLAAYIEKTSGARPEVIEGCPDPVPEHAIWVGYQPKLDELFPDIDFDFTHPEEILIACDGSNLVIAGRDVWDPDHPVGQARGGKPLPGVQREYGTINAVYTFLRDGLGVRWLWPGELGEDVLSQRTVAFEPFEYRYHPQIRMRDNIFRYSGFGYGGSPYGVSADWVRAQRLQLDSLEGNIGGHAFGGWWERFHETHPEYFALQPDGTRSLCTEPGNAKMCMSNPDVWEQWLVDVAEKLEANPNERVFNASAGDGYHQGHCVCENCRAWDHPDGEPRRLAWSGVVQTYVSLSEREVTLANILARKLKERYPDRELYVYTMAYGHARSAPIEVVPDDNVIIGDVANFLFRSDMLDGNSMLDPVKTHREQFAEWGQLTDLHYWRPNVGAPVGGQWGMPDVPLRRTMEDLKFAAENGWMGIYIDYIREYWSTQGPLYYLMAQLTWNPQADGEAILKDYYRRAFGPAAREMEAYWNYMERIREECYGTEQPGRADHDILEFYNEERLGQAYDLLNKAKAALGNDDEIYRERIAFVKAGLDFTRLATECGRMARLVKGKKDPDGKALAKIHANWEELRAVRQSQPGAMRWRMFWAGRDGDGKPNTPRYAPTLWVESAPETAVAGGLSLEEMTIADDWELVFSDNFEREALGDDWELVDGAWEIVDGCLRGTGVLVSSRGFPGGFQRLEFEAMADVQAVDALSDQPAEVTLSDISAFLHAREPGEGRAGSPLATSYFFQFGGVHNTVNRLRKSREILEEISEDTMLIKPDHWHKMVLENDAGTVRLIVDGETVLEHVELGAPLVAEGQDRIGFYSWTAYKVRNLKLYLKNVADLSETE